MPKGRKVELEFKLIGGLPKVRAKIRMEIKGAVKEAVDEAIRHEIGRFKSDLNRISAEITRTVEIAVKSALPGPSYYLSVENRMREAALKVMENGHA